jgi:predicted nucleic acid-binding protein
MPDAPTAAAGLATTSMPGGRVFLDTNVLVYAMDAGAARKRKVSREWLSALARCGDGVISTQVLQEFFVAATRKLGVAPLAAKAVMKTFDTFEVVQVSPILINDAIDCSILNQLSFWDSLVVTAAASAGCTTLLTEDLNHGQLVMGVNIKNPFA